MATLSQISLDNLIQHVDSARVHAYRHVSQAERARNGQYFTPPSVAGLMASFFERTPETVTLLDPGAGAGMLSAAFIARMVGRKDTELRQIEVTAYETEARFLPYLNRTLMRCTDLCRQANIDFNFEIIPKDFIQAGVEILAPTLFEVPEIRQFNAIILNPPYGKISNAGRIKKTLDRVNFHTTNLYAAFLWIAVNQLEAGGELVSITPRSFCNGPYFLSFRQNFLSEVAIKHLHVFEERDTAFSEDNVLQENVIMHAIKQGRRAEVEITASVGPEGDITAHEIPYIELVSPDDPNQVIHVTTNNRENRLRHCVEGLDTTLRDLNIEVSTGKVVDFRVKGLLAEPDVPDVVPLIYPAHFSDGYVVWPIDKYKKPTALRLLTGVDKLLVPRGHYVLVKRFSAKEEKRRITAAVYDPNMVRHKYVGFENHLNYFHSKGQGLPAELAKGLAIYLNSSMADTYFRQFSGHTQVNATDLRSLKYPDAETLSRIGRRVNHIVPNQDEIDAIIAEELGVREQMDSLNAEKKIAEALDILRSLEVPKDQQNARSALTLLALVDIQPSMTWPEATAPLRGITEMMDYFRDHYGVNYAPNTRETVRRYTIHQFWQMGLVVANPDDPDRPVNSPNYCYQIEQGFLDLIRCYGTAKWDASLEKYRRDNPLLEKLKPKSRKMKMLPVTMLDESTIQLTVGGQNRLIKKIIEQFCPRFTPKGKIVYVGDAGLKFTQHDYELLSELGITIDKHSKMPDIVVHMPDQGWLVLIEAVTSHGPIDVKRHNELQELFSSVPPKLIFVTAFESRQKMTRYLGVISWETEVWIADAPDHLIHFDGEHLLEPYV